MNNPDHARRLFQTKNIQVHDNAPIINAFKVTVQRSNTPAHWNVSIMHVRSLARSNQNIRVDVVVVWHGQRDILIVESSKIIVRWWEGVVHVNLGGWKEKGQVGYKNFFQKKTKKKKKQKQKTIWCIQRRM